MSRDKFLTLPFQDIARKAAKWPESYVVSFKESMKLMADDKKIDRQWRIPMNRMLRDMAEGVRTLKVSDDLLWAATKLSVEADPNWLMDQALSARMPFPITALEFDARAKAKMLVHFGAKVEGVDPKIVDEGLFSDRAFDIVFTDQATGARLLTCATLAGDDPTAAKHGVKPSVLFFALAIELDGHHSANYAPAHSLLASEVAAEILGAERSGILKIIAPYGKKGSVIFPEILFSTDIIAKFPDVAERVVSEGRLDATLVGPLPMVAIKKIVGGEAKGGARLAMTGATGEFRCFAALCSLLNRPATIRVAPPLMIDDTPRRGGEEHEYDGDNREYATRLLLPRERVVREILTPRKPRGELTEAHEVGGHWCYSSRRGDRQCSHDWPSEFTRRQFCRKCELLRWWRKDHKRGPGEVLQHKARILDYSGRDAIPKESENVRGPDQGPDNKAA